MTRNFGISSTTPGTAITAMSMAKTTVRPRNGIRASAYPARESKKTRPIVTATVTTIEFVPQST